MSLTSIYAMVFEFKASIILTMSSGTPASLMIAATSLSFTWANALVKFMKHMNAGLSNSMDFSTTCQIVNIACIVDLFFLKSCCSSFMGISSVIIMPMIFW